MDERIERNCVGKRINDSRLSFQFPQLVYLLMSHCGNYIFKPPINENLSSTYLHINLNNFAILTI